ncbi:Protein Wnt-7b [Dermatophagoides farinae]|uniref:Protein Wnt n=1 Tax=Dermatophagoides farinae TaxID=6954 RepID=A0A922I111_DERFA|nr:Protein Wnt-7b [Dermatophagoides farinae]
MFTIRIKVKNFNSILLLCLIISISLNLPNCLCQNMICQRIPNLNRQQLKICQKSPEILSVIRKGIQIALSECQQLFSNRIQLQHSSWNCSSWIQNSLNRLYVNITDIDVKGTKEASFAHALFAAAVVYTLSEACTRSNFPYCSCRSSTKKDYNHQIDMFDIMDYSSSSLSSFFTTTTSSSSSSINEDNSIQSSDNLILLNQEWKWNGCSHNIQFGMETARIFLDSSEHQSITPYSLINLHNNNVGRKIIRDGLIFRCQCHGISGSCTLRTCWHTIRGFRQATQLLYNRYIKAKMVSYSWLNKSFKQRYEKQIRKKSSTIKSNQLKQLQKAFHNITLFELNQPNMNRLNNNNNNDIKNSKASKRDLIYIKPSINHCQIMKRSLLMNNNRILTKEKRLTNRPIICMAENFTTTTTTTTDDDDNDNDLNIDGKNYNHQQWPPIESCDKICCNFGYRKKTRLKIYKCECVFQFCCSIVCKSSCSTYTTEYECNDHDNNTENIDTLIYD